MIVDGEEAKMGINGIPYADSEPVTASIGTPQIWHVQNLTAYSHPFHMHGFYFEALDDSGALRTPRQLKDTIEIPTTSTVSLVPRFDPPSRSLDVPLPHPRPR